MDNLEIIFKNFIYEPQKLVDDCENMLAAYGRRSFMNFLAINKEYNRYNRGEKAEYKYELTWVFDHLDEVKQWLENKTKRN